jgi:hypothetical protein
MKSWWSYRIHQGLSNKPLVKVFKERPEELFNIYKIELLIFTANDCDTTQKRISD